MFGKSHHRNYRIIKHSKYFNRSYYKKYYATEIGNMDPIEHYLKFGWKQGLNPSERFDTNLYLTLNPDVRDAHVNPLLHYEKFGRAEHRSLTRYSSMDILLLKNSPYFDAKYYMKNYPECGRTEQDAIRHYLAVGFKNGCNPSPLFDNDAYRSCYTDIFFGDINPLIHWLKHGRDEGRVICPVDTENTTQYPTVDSGTILLVSHEMSLTGAPIALMNLARALQKHGKKFLILSPAPGKLESELQRYNLPYFVDNKLFVRLQNKNSQTVQFLQQFDTVLLNTIVCAKYAHLIRPYVKKLMLWVHDGALGYANESRMVDLESEYKHLDVIYSVGRYSKSFTDKYTRGPSGVLLYGIDDVSAGVPQQSDTKRKKLVFGIFGTCDMRKAQQDFVIAVKKLPRHIRENCEFNVVGRLSNNRYCKKLKSIARGTPVHFTGELTHDETLREMARTDVVVCASVDDPMPIVCTEAMMLNKPVICSDHTGTASFIKDGENSFLYRLGMDKLSAVMARAYENRASLPDMGVRWNMVYQKNFTPTVFEQNVLDVFFRQKCLVLMNNVKSMNVPYCEMYSDKFVKLVDENTGNVLIQDYGSKQLNYDFVYDNKLGTNDNQCIIFAANALRNGVKLTCSLWEQVFKNYHGPINILGLGAQATLEEMNPTEYAKNLSDEIVWWARSVSERCVSMGVRGEFTADVLKALGIKNVDVVGCPTWFVNGHNQPEIRKKEFSELRHPVFHTCWEPYTEWHALWNRAVLENMLPFPDPRFVIQSEFNFLPYLIMNRDPLQAGLAITQEDLRKSVNAICAHFALSETDVLENPKIRNMFEIFSDMNKWGEFMKTRDVAFGFRIHGNIIALKNGVPAINIVTDSRVYEMCSLFKIPFVQVNQLASSDLNFRKIYEETDFTEMNKIYPKLLDNFVAFLNKNGIKHFFD